MPTPTLTLERQRVIDNFRNALLFALDNVALRQFRGAKLPKQPGATDADLPALFAVIDAHALTLADRYGVVLTPLEDQ